MSFEPRFQITPQSTKALMAIEADRQAITQLPLTPLMLQSLRESARLMTTHYSTQIEGNRLTQAQVRDVLDGGHFPGRERDENEVKNYFKALEFVEQQAQTQGRLTEKFVQRIHGLAFDGRDKPTPYRDGQNVIRNSTDGAIVYLPPEAHDVPPLMRDLVAWINHQTQADVLPIPIIAALAHCEFATIHPYYDGNGRTARLLTTFILHRFGYSLKGIYSLEAYYARKLDDYYAALTLGEGHNYYVGNRAEADVTPFVDYFIAGMAASFANVRKHAEAEKQAGKPDQAAPLRRLSPQQRQVLELFRDQDCVNSKQVAENLGLSQRQAGRYCLKWVADGFFMLADSAKRTRRYRLAAEYESMFAEG